MMMTQVSIWHRDITLVTPRQMKGSPRQYQIYGRHKRPGAQLTAEERRRQQHRQQQQRQQSKGGSRQSRGSTNLVWRHGDRRTALVPLQSWVHRIALCLE